MNSVNPLFGDNLVGEALPLDQILSLALEGMYQSLREFAASPEFIDKMRLAFGESFAPETAISLAQNWAKGDVIVPPIQVLLSATLNGAYGGYASATNTIYLSEEFLRENTLSAITIGILEEFGHSVDGLLNDSDTLGDEGQIFAGLVRGIPLPESKLQALKQENDFATIYIDGQAVQIEQASLSDSGGKGGTNRTLQLDPLPLGQTEKNVTLTYFYEHFVVPDQFEVRYGEISIFNTEKLVRGSKSDSIVFKQVAGNDKLDIIVTAPTDGTDWNFFVSTDNPQINFDGLLGDVIKLDLGQQRGNLILKSLPDDSKGKLIDEEGENATVGKEYKTLYYVPKLTGAIQTYGQNRQPDPGLDHVIFGVEDQDKKSLTVRVSVNDGFSTSGDNTVTFEKQKIDIYRQQQRLAYLGFPGNNSKPLVVDGVSSGNTNWAIRLFNSVVGSSRKLLTDTTFSKDAKGLINVQNAPQWSELKKDSIEGVGIVQRTSEVWAANWAFKVLQSVVSSANNYNFNLNGASLKKGGNSLHSGHEAGMDLDIDVAGRGDGSYVSGNMFFKENKFKTETWYVEAPNGKVIVKNATSEKYEAAEPTSANLAKALKGSTLHNDKKVIEQLFVDANSDKKADPNEWLIVDNPDATFSNQSGTHKKGYDLQTVRALISSFLNANVGGVTVTLVRFNDPRTWDLDSKRVKFTNDHNGHIHLDIKAPSAASNLNNFNQKNINFLSTSTDSSSVINPLNPLAPSSLTLLNDSLSKAIELGKIEGNLNFNGTISSTAPAIYYRFTLGNPVDENQIEGPYFNTLRDFSLLLNGLSADADVEVIQDFNEDGIRQDDEVIANSSQPGNSGEIIDLTDLNEGIYYIRIFQKSGDTNYNLSLTVPPLPVSPDNAGNTPTNAQDLGALNGSITRSDFIGAVDSDDYYRFNLATVSDFSLEVNGLDQGDLFVYLEQDINNDGVIDSDETIAISDAEGNEPEAINVNGLAVGAYIVWLSRNSGNTNYNLNLSATASVIPADKAGSTLATAFALGSLTTSIQSDFVGNVDPIDYYRFTLTNPSGVILNLSGLSADADLGLFQDKNGDGEISSDEVIQRSEATDNQDENINITALPAGDYFIKVFQYDGDTTYNLSLTPTSATGPDLEVTVTPITTPLTLGGKVNYTVTIKNIGASTAAGVIVRDNLPLGSVLDMSAVVSERRKGIASIYSNEISTAIATLNANESVTIAVSARLIGSGPFSSLIQASSSNTDYNPDNNSVVQRFYVAPGTIQPADLELSLTSDKTNANINDLVTFRITLTNKGPGAATSIQVKNVLSQGLTFWGSSSQQGFYNPVSGIWNAGNIATNNQAFVNIFARVTSGGSPSNTAEVIALAEPDPDSTPNNNNPNEDDQATVTVTVTSSNQPLQAISDVATATQNTPITIAVLANDSDGNGDPIFLAFFNAISTQGGTVSRDENGTPGNLTDDKLLYTPATGFNGIDSFTYTISDGTDTSTAIVSIDVTSVSNQSPQAANDAATATQNTPITIAVLANDSDGNGDPIFLAFFNTISTQGGTVSRDENGTPGNLTDDKLLYTPATGFNGIDSFTYTISDGTDTSTAIVSIDVTSVSNQSPQAANDVATATQNTPLTLAAATLLSNDTDPDPSDILSITGVSNSSNGIVQLNGTNVIFTPAPGFIGQAGFDYSISDGKGGNSSANVGITVNPFLGTPGRDTITGTDLDDILVGGLGADNLTGKQGKDQFVYQSIRDAGDIIKDFEVTQDNIVLTALLDSLGYGGSNPIADGYLKFGSRGSDAVILIDEDGLAPTKRALPVITVEKVALAAMQDPNNFIF